MSMEVIKAGIADTFQDGGRYGHQHLGINPNGAMDLIAMHVANALAGNEMNEAVLELCFPASVLLFRKPALMALSGANFNAALNGKPVPLNQSISVPAGSELKFTRIEKGVFGYLAIHGGFGLVSWLNSVSTNAKAHMGGWKGRSLQKGDEIPLRKEISLSDEVKIFPWRANVVDFYSDSKSFQFLRGNEFDWLDEQSKKKLAEDSFVMTAVRDRMGYRLKGEALTRRNAELISTAATFGTIQLLPDGQLIILMADHQTTGGYPRIAQVIAADRSRLVQRNVGEVIQFQQISLGEAEDLMVVQRKTLKQIQVTCAGRLKDFFNATP
jgi:antagonist of KipI